MRILVVILFSCICSVLLAQQEGLPFYRVYEPQEYQAHRQNWTLDQGEDGTLFFANTKGLLIYNGEKWKLERLPNLGHVRSLKVVRDKVYVGANNELGYFQNNKGDYTFHSFLPYVPENLKNFGRVWTTVVIGEEVYFQTDSFVIRIGKDGSTKHWTFEEGRIWKLILLNDDLFLIVLQKGLYQLDKKDTFVLHPNYGEFEFAGSEFLLPVGNGWIFEKGDTLAFFDGKESSPFENEASEIFREYGINTAILTSSGKIIVATLRKGGVVILDQNGRLERHLNSENGFTNNVVRGIFEDDQKAIWFALEDGISRMDLDSPLSYFDSRLGLNGTVMDVHIFRDKLYVATTDGLMVMGDEKFERVNNNKSIVWDLDTIQNQLLAVTSFDDTFVVDKNGNTSSLAHQKSAAKDVNRRILPLKESPKSAVILFHTGIFQIYWDGTKWLTLNRMENLFLSASGIEQSKPGVLWIATNINGLYRIKYKLDKQGLIHESRISIKNYKKESGVPEGFKRIFTVAGAFYFQAPDDRFYRYFPEQDSFQEVSALAKSLHISEDPINVLGTEFLGESWFSSERSLNKYLYRVVQKDTGQRTVKFPLGNEILKIRDPFSTLEFHSSGKNLFFGGSKGLISYDLSKLDGISKKVPLKIHQVITKDSVWHAPSNSDISLKYNASEIRFEFASSVYKDAENKKYQYFLDGFDKTWSLPLTKNYAEYTSLPPGEYVFKVKAINDYFFESDMVTFSFAVKRPWFWNHITMPLYVLFLVLSTYIVSQWRTKNLKRKNLSLEKAINQAVEETQRQSSEIAHLYEVKNQFFSNISHELRTPLTLILGPVSDLLENESLSIKQRNKLTFISNNARRLLKLINQLLDLSKLEAGKLDLKASQQNIVSLASTITESFSSMAKTRKIHLKFDSEHREVFVFYDTDKMEKILINLLSNAMKFTPAKGEIKVSVSKDENSCTILVKDSGAGINQDQLPYIFDRFFQADNSESREHEGTGIGLSLTKELVELHGGVIQVESALNKGSTFRVVLPTGKAHLGEHQLTKLSSPKFKKQDEHILPVSIPTEKTGGNLEKALLLLVEDNAEMRSYIKSHLEAEFGIEEAENGEMGLDMAKELVPDLIISDVMMPKMDGAQLCREIKRNEITSHIPIVLLTAKASEEDRIKGLMIEADAYLAKPFNKLELKVVVNNLISNRKKLQKRFAKTTLISPKEIAVTSMEQQFLEKLIEEIEEHIGDDKLGVEQLAISLNLSRSQLHRKMTSIMSITPSLYLRKYRLERAKKLLESGAGRVSDIAYQVGFSSPSYFTKCFVEEFGHTPTEMGK